MDESVLSTYSEAVLMRLEDEFKQSERGYRVTPLGGDRYKVSYTGDGKEHMPHSVCHGALRRTALEHPFQHALALFMQVVAILADTSSLLLLQEERR